MIFCDAHSRIGQHASSVFRFVDLRFASATLEADFKTDLEKCLLKYALIAAFMNLLLSAGFFPVRILREAARAEDPFSWCLTDPRTFYFAGVCARTLVALVVVVLICLRQKFQLLVNMDWELMILSAAFAFSTTWILQSSLAYVKLGGHEHISQGVWTNDHSWILWQIVWLTVICLYLPIRTCRLWMVPAMTVLTSVLLMISHSISHGVDFLSSSSQLHFQWNLMSLFFFHGVWRHEKLLRDQWSDLAAYSVLLGNSCDAVVHLDHNVKIGRIAGRHGGILGTRTKVLGHSFLEILSEADKARFLATLETAVDHGNVTSMPSTCLLPGGKTEAQLAIVATGSVAWPYIIGLQLSDIVPSFESTFGNLVDLSYSSRIPDDDMRSTTVMTTRTGHVFNDLVSKAYSNGSTEYVLQGVSQYLRDIVDIGHREHWLAAPGDIELIPEFVLGRGGFGTVIAGKLRGTAVAVKISNNWSEMGGADMRFVRSVSNELRLSRYIRHPNIVQFFGACVAPGARELALLYELVSGDVLHTYVMGDPKSGLKQPTPAQRLKVLLDISSALCYLHSLRPPIAHGDLKPSNIIVERFHIWPRAKLLDFGLSRLLTKRVRPLGGTRNWVAPEVKHRKLQETWTSALPRADVYSFGLIAFFVILGRRPDKTGGQHCERARRDAAAQLPDDFALLCQECLGENPKKRPDMATVQVRLLRWVPDHNTCSRDVQTLLLPSVSWDEGLQKVCNGGETDSPGKTSVLAHHTARGARISELEHMHNTCGQPCSDSDSPAPTPARIVSL